MQQTSTNVLVIHVHVFPASATHRRGGGCLCSLVCEFPLLSSPPLPSPEVGPYASLSPEALQAMVRASEATSNSRLIRQQLYSAIDHTQRKQEAAHSSVNEGLTRKLAQTVTLTVRGLLKGCPLTIA